MSELHVGIGDYAVSHHSNGVIKTFALGSCVAIIIYDRLHRTAGLIHMALPESSVNPEKARRQPGYFVDSGIPVLLRAMKIEETTRKDLRIKIVGGSNIMDDSNRFNIGKRNILAVKKHLWKHGLGIIAEETGGSISRTVSVAVDDGTVVISSGARKWNI